MKNTNMVASHEWATRPKDQRFANLFDLLKYLERRTQMSRETSKPIGDIRVRHTDNGDVVVHGGKSDAAFTNFSFGQIASLAGLSPTMLRNAVMNFPGVEGARWAAEGINYGLEARLADKDQAHNANVLIRLPNGDGGKLPTIRSIHTEVYSRAWDHEIVQKLLLPLHEYGFVNPPAADGPAGLYASDRDMFALLAPKGVKRLNMPDVKDTDGGFGGFEVGGQMYYPFLMVRHSEVGVCSFHLWGGLLQEICGNHILWGVRDEVKYSVKHVGEVWKRISERFYNYVQAWTKAGTHAERQAIEAAMNHFVAKDTNGVIDYLRKEDFTKKVAQAAVDAIEAGDKSTGIVSQDPTNLWNLVAAITANAREIPYQDERKQLERQAGKLLATVVAN